MNNNKTMPHWQVNTRLYNIWKKLKPNLYKKWQNFNDFYKDIWNPPENLYIARIDENTPFSPWNIKWVTNLEKNNSKKNTIWIETWSWKETLSNLCRKYKKSYNNIYSYRFRFCNSDFEVMTKLKSC